MAQVGDSYVFGATGPIELGLLGPDDAGVRLGRHLAAALLEGAVRLRAPHLRAAQLQPGDLVFYYCPIHHVGIYIGGGVIVHAANPSAGVGTASLYSMPFSGAVRPY